MLALADEDGPGLAPLRLYGASQHEVFRLYPTGWVPIGEIAGYSRAIYGLGAFDIDGPGPRSPSIFVGGDFATVSGVAAHGLARYGCEEIWSQCIGDANGDELVDFGDVVEVLEYWGASGAEAEFADLNSDDVVGMTDIVAVLTSFGQDCNAGRRVAREPRGGSEGSRVHARDVEGFAEITRRIAEGSFPR